MPSAAFDFDAVAGSTRQPSDATCQRKPSKGRARERSPPCRRLTCHELREELVVAVDDVD